jgi:hypothetical protein
MQKKYISFEELKELNDEGCISYSDKLRTIEWRNRRDIILQRDKYTCQKCQTRHSLIINNQVYINYSVEEEEKFILNLKEELLKYQNMMGINIPVSQPKKILHRDYQPKYLHVHHKYYIIDTLPWDYVDDALISLCGTCHQETHNDEDIPVYENELKELKLLLNKCSRCKGSGYLKEFNYNMDGICFQCNGDLFEEKW